LSPGAKRELTSFGVDNQLKKCYAQFGPKTLPDDFRLDGPIFYSEEKAEK